MDLGYRNQRSPATEQFRHVIDNLARKQSAAFAINKSQFTGHFGEIFRQVAKFKAFEDLVVEFPTPAAVDFRQRASGDMFEDKGVLTRLRGNESEALEGSFAIGIDFFGPDLGPPIFVIPLKLWRTDGKIHDNHPAELFPIKRPAL